MGLGDGAGGPDVLVLAAAARADVVPALLVGLVAVVDGDVVGRVPDVDIALRGLVAGAAIGLEADAQRQLEVKAHADVDVDEVANIKAEVKRGAGLVGRSQSGSGKGHEDGGLHFDCFV